MKGGVLFQNQPKYRPMSALSCAMIATVMRVNSGVDMFLSFWTATCTSWEGRLVGIFSLFKVSGAMALTGKQTLTLSRNKENQSVARLFLKGDSREGASSPRKINSLEKGRFPDLDFNVFIQRDVARPDGIHSDSILMGEL